MRFQPKLLLVFFSVAIFCLQALAAGTTFHHSKNSYPDSSSLPKQPAEGSKSEEYLLNRLAGNCYDINWATWSNIGNVTSTTGSIVDADGTPISVTMSANYSFDSTPSIYSHSRLNTYPSPIPNTTVPRTTWAVGTGGTTTMCFSRKVTNPVLLLASLGSSAPISSRLDFSIPYVVLHDGGGMVYNSSTALTGTEGYAVIMFPGEFTCVTISSNTPEFYTNITWGIRPQPFVIDITDNPGTCGSATVTASGGVTYKWNGGDTPNSATNTFRQSGTYLVTVTNANGCVTSASKTVDVNSAINPTVTVTAQSCGSITLTATGATSYQWSGGNNPNSATNTFTVGGNYYLTAFNGVGCSQTVSQSVNIPNISGSSISAVTTQLCLNVPLLLTGNQPLGYTPALSYSWQSSYDGIYWTDIVNGSQQNLLYSNSTNQDTYIRRVTKLDLCTDYSNVLQLKAPIPLTASNAGPAQTVCANAPVTLNANSSGSDEIGTWSIISPAGFTPFNASNVNNPSATISDLPANVDVVFKWTITKLQCTSSSESTVTVRANSLPGISAGDNVIINLGEGTMLIGTVPPVYTNFIWAPATGLDNPNSLTPVAAPVSTTTYTLTASNNNGCSSTATVKVIVNNDLEIPNTITPNNDGLNDVWNIRNLSNYTGVTVNIFNRYGAPVYFSVGYHTPWNGTNNGRKLPAGVYYYVIAIKDISIKKTGYITVLY